MSSRVAGDYSFSMAQNHDRYLVEQIQQYYGVQHLKRNNKTGGVSGNGLSVGGCSRGSTGNRS